MVERSTRAWRPAIGPIETWSSWFALVGIESAEAGWARPLFSEARAAAVYWRSMKPASRPESDAEERRQAAVQVRVEEERGPALADRAELGERELREVERERDRLAVEVAAGDDAAAARRARRRRPRRRRPGRSAGCPWPRSSRSRARARGGRARRGPRRGPGARSAASTGPGPCARDAWCDCWSVAVAQEPAQLGRDRDLARDAAARPGSAAANATSVPSSASTDIAAATLAVGDEPLRVRGEQRAERGHQLRAVEDREALLRARARAARGRSRAARSAPARPARRAPPARARSAAAPRCASGARSPEAPTEPCAGTTGWIPRRRKSSRRSATTGRAPEKPERERVRPQQEHRPDDLARQRLAHARGVADEQVLLEPLGVRRGRSSRFGERARRPW